jgi:cytochrome c biogenesis protein CcmG, thiol:disulfide interchange protein DsbE
MTTRQQWGLVLAVVLLLSGGLYAATHYLSDELFPVTVGSAAPPFTAATVDARPRAKSLADYKGQVVLLNIWATWCLPCRTEMPSIQALHRAFGPRGLKVVAVSIDDPGSEQAIRDFASEYGLTFEILHDASGEIQRTYQTTGVPETFVIGADGVIRKKVIGAADWDSPANRALFAQLLGGPAAPAPRGEDAAESVGVRASR